MRKLHLKNSVAASGQSVSRQAPFLVLILLLAACSGGGTGPPPDHLPSAAMN
jgi:hypothetical protein